jgi:hypothetical protein
VGTFKKKIKKLLTGILHLRRLQILFVGFVFSFLILSVIQVDCPICSNIVIDEQAGDLTSLKLIEITPELVEHKVTYPGCGYSYAFCTYDVAMVIVNEGTELWSSPILLHGDIPDEAILAHPTWVEKNAKLITTDIAGGESKQIKVSTYIWIVGLDVSKTVASEARFSIITNPRKIKSSCNICDGEGKMPFNQWLIEVIK